MHHNQHFKKRTAAIDSIPHSVLCTLVKIMTILDDPLHPSSSAPHCQYLYYTVLSTWFSVFLSVSFLVPVQPSSLRLACPYHFSVFSVICFATDATFIDRLRHSFLILSFFATPHIHHRILILFTSSLLSLPFANYVAMMMIWVYIL